MTSRRNHKFSALAQKLGESKRTDHSPKEGSENIDDSNESPMVDIWLWDNNQFVRESVFQNTEDKMERPRVLVALKSFEDNADAFDGMHHAYGVMRDELSVASKRLADGRLGYYREIQYLRDELRKTRISISSEPLKNRITSFEKYVRETEVYFFNLGDTIEPQLKEAMQDAVREMCRKYIAAGFTQLPLNEDEIEVSFPKNAFEIAVALKDLVVNQVISPEEILNIAGDAAINHGKQNSMQLVRETAYAVADRAAAKEGMHRRISGKEEEILSKRLAYVETKLAESKASQFELQRGLQYSQGENFRLKQEIDRLKDDLEIANAQISMLETAVTETAGRIYKPKLRESFSDFIEIEETADLETSPVAALASPLAASTVNEPLRDDVPSLLPSLDSAPSRCITPKSSQPSPLKKLAENPAKANLQVSSPRSRKNSFSRRAKCDLVEIDPITRHLEISTFSIENIPLVDTAEVSSQTNGVSLSNDFFRIFDNSLEKVEKPIESPVANLAVFIRNIRKFVSSHTTALPRLPNFGARQLPNLPAALGASLMSANPGQPVKFLGSVAGVRVNKTWKLFLF